MEPRMRHLHRFGTFCAGTGRTRHPALTGARARMNVKLRLVLFVVVTALVGSVPAVASAAILPRDAPLLWRGRVVDANGDSTAATVSAVLAPPPGIIPMRD